MKIAIASQGNSKDSLISPIGARSNFFLIFDEKGKLLKTIENPFLVGGGAGFGVASMLAEEGVDAVIAGSFGPNMASALSQSGIEIYSASGISVSQALESFLNGSLSPTSVQSQPGFGYGRGMGYGRGYGRGMGYGRGFGRGYGRGFGQGRGRGFFGRFFGRWF